jgi:hypothetical protein
VKKELAGQQKRQSESNRFMEMIAGYKGVTQLNSAILNELVHSIQVGAIRMADGVKRRSIKIKYRQFCYVEIFPGEELFGGWDASTWEA